MFAKQSKKAVAGDAWEIRRRPARPWHVDGLPEWHWPPVYLLVTPAPPEPPHQMFETC